MDYQQLLTQRRTHPAWRLLAADRAPMIASFPHRSFIAPNLRTIARQQLASQLDDHLYHLHEVAGEILFPKSAVAYLDDWAADERGWLRKYYPSGQDEPHYDLSSSTEQAIEWLAGLGQRQFIGTESRLMTVFDLLHQIIDGTELKRLLFDFAYQLHDATVCQPRLIVKIPPQLLGQARHRALG